MLRLTAISANLQKLVHIHVIKNYLLVCSSELSILPEELREFSSLRIFKNVQIPPDEPKPPVITSNTKKLTDDELAVLKKGPMFTIRNVMNKEAYMAEVEKGLAQKMYSDIGKDVEDKVNTEDDNRKKQRE